LAAEGYTTRDLATVLGVSAQSAAHYLSGRRGTPEALAGALRRMVGAKAADGVLELIPRG
jgi:predicted transcriptional regulator